MAANSSPSVLLQVFSEFVKDREPEDTSVALFSPSTFLNWNKQYAMPNFEKSVKITGAKLGSIMVRSEFFS